MGTTAGRLVTIKTPDLTYPGLVDIGHRVSKVSGQVMTPTRFFQQSDLDAINEWEDYNPSSPETSLYRMEIIRIAMSLGGTINAAAYVYQGPQPASGLPPSLS